MTLRLLYTNARGAGVVEMLSAEAAIARIKVLRREARLETEDGRVVGGIEAANGGHDDRRVRWNWWFDAAEAGK